MGGGNLKAYDPARQVRAGMSATRLAVWLDGRSSMGKLLGDVANLPGYPSDISNLPVREWLAEQPRQSSALVD